MSDEFTTGKLVMLASGGGAMTVDWLGEDPSGDLVPCAWFDTEKRYFERKFSRTALQPYKSQYEMMMEGANMALAERGVGPLPL